MYEDEYLLVVNKPAGMVTHPAYKNYSGTLVNALLYHSQSLSQPHPLRPGIVHRLDKDTSGLLVVAKDETTHQKLSRQFANKTTEREYRAIVWGVFKAPEGIIEASLGRSKSDRKKVAVVKEGKYAVTEYEVMEQFAYLALLRLHLRTGRTHQIRVHLAHIHHPVFGDETYGGRKIAAGGIDGKKKAEAANLLEKISRQALHAKKLGFVHPVTKEFMRFDSELPEDMKTGAGVSGEIMPSPLSPSPKGRGMSEGQGEGADNRWGRANGETIHHIFSIFNCKSPRTSSHDDHDGKEILVIRQK